MSINPADWRGRQVAAGLERKTIGGLKPWGMRTNLPSIGTRITGDAQKR